MEHDITHCSGENCNLREHCYRYKAHQDVIAHGITYVSYLVRNNLDDNGEKCNYFWNYQEILDKNKSLQELEKMNEES